MQFKVGRLDTFVSDILGTIGYSLAQVKIRGLDGKKVVQIMFERLDGKCVTISDCETATKALSKRLDDENFIRGPYDLELSSCGIDRPLVGCDDFVRFCGKYVKTRLYNPVEGKRNIDGFLLCADSDGVTIEYEVVADAPELGDNVHIGSGKNRSRGMAKNKKSHRDTCFVKRCVRLGYGDIRSANIDGWKCIHNSIPVSDKE